MRKIKPPHIPSDACAEEMTQASSRRQNSYLRQIPLCPVFEPTLEEFTQMSFQEYMAECEKMIEPSCGIFKVGEADSIVLVARLLLVSLFYLSTGNHSHLLSFSVLKVGQGTVLALLSYANLIGCMFL